MTRILSLVLALCAATAAQAEDPANGAQLFSNHCATCHGPTGEGDGPMRAVLSVPPADLTALSATNGGTFPLARVIRRIDGTTEVMAHGGPMPIFGLILDGPSEAVLAPDGSELVAAEAIVDIVSWLRGVQR